MKLSNIKSSIGSKRFFLTIILSILMLFSIILAVPFIANADSGAQINVPAEQTYGSVYRLPKLSVDVDGKTVEAQTILYKPDGTSTTTQAISLNQAGVYRLEFWYNGKQIAEQKSFTVYYPYVQFGGKGSTAVYEEGNGLVVNTQAGVKMSFNEIVDLSTLTSSTVLYQMYVTPTVPGVQDFNRFDIFLTDVYDESNYLTIHVENTSETGLTTSYVRAGAAFQPLTGRENWSPEEKVHTQSYGAPVKFTFYGKPEDESSNLLSIYYDTEAQRIYTQNGYLVIDLDDEKYFSNPWGGFTDGKVRISVMPSNGTIANYVVTNVYGLDFSETLYEDTEAPTLTLDTPVEIPVAKPNTTYPVFDSVAFDDYAGNVSVNTKVYLNYYSNTPYSVAVKNGVFTPTRAGTYTIEYSAIDHFGNKVVKTVDVVCSSNVADLSIELAETQQSGKAGEWIEFADVTVSGGSGEKTVDVSVEYAGGEEYAVEGNKFKPYKAGEYSIVYTVKDYLGTEKVLINKVVIKTNPDPVFEYEFNLPKYFIADAKYALPEVYATDFSADRKQLAAEITVTDAQGERKLGSNVYQPAIGKNGEIIHIVYSVKNATGSVSKEFDVPTYTIRNDDGIEMSSYFISDKKVAKKYTSTGLSFTATQDTTLSYLNALLLDKLEMNFSVNAGNALGALTIELEDKYNSTEKMYISFRQKNGAVVADINGAVIATTDFKFTTEGANFFVAYNTTAQKVKLGTKLYSVNNMPTFSSGYVFVSWKFEDVKGDSVLSLNKLNNQTFSEDGTDITKPQVTLLNAGSGRLQPGATAISPIALAGDVLDPYAVCTLTVEGADKKIMTDVNGVKLENVPADKAYQFVCNEYGSYTLTYTIVDSSNNATSVTSVVKVWDGDGPAINVETATINAKVGETVDLPTASATDAVSGECTVYTCVKTPVGRINHLKEASYKFDKAGKYVVIYYAMDANGNLSSVEVTVNVK